MFFGGVCVYKAVTLLYRRSTIPYRRQREEKEKERKAERERERMIIKKWWIGEEGVRWEVGVSPVLRII